MRPSTSLRITALAVLFAGCTRGQSREVTNVEVQMHRACYGVDAGDCKKAMQEWLVALKKEDPGRVHILCGSDLRRASKFWDEECEAAGEGLGPQNER